MWLLEANKEETYYIYPTHCNEAQTPLARRNNQYGAEKRSSRSGIRSYDVDGNMSTRERRRPNQASQSTKMRKTES